MTLTLLALLACTGDKASDTETTGEPGAADTADATGATAPSGDTGVGDTGVGDTGVGGAAPDSVTARIDEHIGSLVYVSWEQRGEASAWVEYSFDDDEWRSTPPATVSGGPREQLLLGVPFDHEVTYRVVNEISGTSERLTSEEGAITTAALPADLPAPDVVTGDQARWDASLPYVLLTMQDSATYDRSWAFIIDRQGRVVWAWELERGYVSLHSQLSFDGSHLLIDNSTYWSVFDLSGSELLRMTLDGTIVEAVPAPGHHHPFTELDDGALVWAAIEGRNEVLYSHAPDGTVTALWDCAAFLTSIDQWDPDSPRDDCGSNTLRYNPSTDSLLFSLYSHETMIEIDRATGETLRWFGHLPGGWTFARADDAFWWQHGGYFTDEGTLLVSSKVSERGAETVVREYQLNSADETMALLWEFGEGEGVYGDTMGEAHRLPGGNTLHNYGSAAQLREITPGGEVVWDADWYAPFMGRSTPIGDLYALAP